MGKEVKVTIRGDNKLGSTITQAERQLQQLSQAAENFTRVLQAVGIGEVVKKMADMVTGSIEAAHNFELLSQKTGVSVESLSGLAYAARMSDVDVSGMEKGLKFLSKSMVDAASGGAKSAAAFRAFGVDVKDADGKVRPVQDVLMDLAARFATMPDGAEKAAASLIFFGRSGLQMVPMLNQGADGIQRMVDHAGQMGLVMSGPAAAAMTQLAEQAKDMRARLEGLALQLTSGMVPGLERTFIVMKQAADGMGGMKTIGAGLGTAISTLAEAFHTLGYWTAYSGLAAVKWSLQMQKIGPMAVSPEFRAQLDQQIADVKLQMSELSRLHEVDVLGLEAGLPAVPKKKGGEDAADLADALSKAEHGAGKEAKAMKIGHDTPEVQASAALFFHNLGLQEETWKAMLPTITASADAFKSQDDALNKAAGDMVVATRTVDENYQAELKLIDTLVQLGKITEETAQRARAAALERRDAADGELQAQKKRNEEMRREMKDLAHVVGTAFEDAFIQMKGPLDVLKGALQDFERVILRAFITKPLENWFATLAAGGGWLSKLFGGGGGGKGGGTDWFATMAHMNFFAAGGDYGPGFRVVGENGPELDYSSSSGHIISNRDLRAGLGGGGGFTYIDNRKIDARGATAGERERLAIAANQMKNQTKLEVFAALAEFQRRS